MSRVMSNATFCLNINAKTKSQIKCADQRLCLRYRGYTSVSDPENRFSPDAAHIQLRGPGTNYCQHIP